ncbi:hypothetical protein ACQ4PT_050079 [Festuca glaucescens]
MDMRTEEFLISRFFAAYRVCNGSILVHLDGDDRYVDRFRGGVDDVSGGWVYFLQPRSEVYGLSLPGVFSYNLIDGKAKFMERVPLDLSDRENEAFMWQMPQPAITPIQVIREKLESPETGDSSLKIRISRMERQTTHSKEHFISFNVQNLPLGVDSSRLRRFFNKHGKVSNAEVTSLGKGAVIMAMETSTKPFEASRDALDGLVLDGYTLKVSEAMGSGLFPLTMAINHLNMSSLTAAATEYRFRGMGRMDRKINENKEDKCCVRIHGNLMVSYMIRAVGGSGLPAYVHQEEPKRFNQSFDLYDPDTFFRSYTACRDTIHQMLMHTPILRDFDLGADNWDNFMPHEVAMWGVGFFRRDMHKAGGVALRYTVDMTLTIWADVIYNERKALFLACIYGGLPSTPAAAATMSAAVECCVYMEDLAAAAAQAQHTVRLPCSHSFHRD